MMDKEFIQHTIEVWQPLYQKKLTEEDAREIIHNMTGFFNLLAEWKAKENSLDNPDRNHILPSPY